jgi:hypothetical protein
MVERSGPWDSGGSCESVPDRILASAGDRLGLACEPQRGQPDQFDRVDPTAPAGVLEDDMLPSEV